VNERRCDAGIRKVRNLGILLMQQFVEAMLLVGGFC